MNTSDVIRTLDAVLTDERVIRDASGVISRAGRDGWTDIEVEGTLVHVPHDAEMKIVTKAFFKEYIRLGFGSGYRVQVAVGGVQNIEFGLASAKYCFATLYYNERLEMFTIDFHESMR